MMYTPEQAEKRVKDNIGSLEALCKEAICCADLNLMLAMGFPEGASRRICEIIKDEATSLDISNLEEHYIRSVEEGKSNIINTIVRRKHRMYFATRANLHPMIALEHFTGKDGGTDVCSALFNRSLSQAATMKKQRREAILDKEIKRLARPTDWLDQEDNAGGTAAGIHERGDFSSDYYLTEDNSCFAI